MSPKKYSTLDFFVLSIIVLTFLALAINTVVSQYLPRDEVLDRAATAFYIEKAMLFITILFIPLILTWMLYGGVNSSLWNWLPPFCFFFWCTKWQRWVFVLLFLGAILAGLVKLAGEPF
jgi:hypothetical protein